MNIYEYLKEKGGLSLGDIIRKIDEFTRFEYLEKEQRLILMVDWTRHEYNN